MEAGKKPCASTLAARAPGVRVAKLGSPFWSEASVELPKRLGRGNSSGKRAHVTVAIHPALQAWNVSFCGGSKRAKLSQRMRLQVHD